MKKQLLDNFLQYIKIIYCMFIISHIYVYYCSLNFLWELLLIHYVIFFLPIDFFNAFS